MVRVDVVQASCDLGNGGNEIHDVMGCMLHIQKYTCEIVRGCVFPEGHLSMSTLWLESIICEDIASN